MDEQLTLFDLQARLADHDLNCHVSTVKKYVRLGLLPKGQKLPGRGNVAYWPGDAVERILPRLQLMRLSRLFAELSRQPLSRKELTSLAREVRKSFEKLGVNF